MRLLLRNYYPKMTLRNILTGVPIASMQHVYEHILYGGSSKYARMKWEYALDPSIGTYQSTKRNLHQRLFRKGIFHVQAIPWASGNCHSTAPRALLRM
jgi:hypothetical protein